MLGQACITSITARLLARTVNTLAFPNKVTRRYAGKFPRKELRGLAPLQLTAGYGSMEMVRLFDNSDQMTFRMMVERSSTIMKVASMYDFDPVIDRSSSERAESSEKRAEPRYHFAELTVPIGMDPRDEQNATARAGVGLPVRGPKRVTVGRVWI
jgi:hypothetical protein